MSSFQLKIKALFASRGLFVTLFVLGLATLYYYMVNAGVLTHDELHSLMTVREGVYLEEGIAGYLISPRGLFILDVFAQYPQFCVTSETAYRLFDIIAIGIAIYCAYRFMRMLFSEEIGRLFVALFFICASFSNTDHNAFLAFGWTYKIHIAYLFLLLELIVWHVKTGKRLYLVASVLLYVFVSGLYEAFVTTCVPIAVLYIYLFKQTGELTAKHIGKYALYYAIPEIIYLAFYYFLAATAPTHYSGTTVSSSLTFGSIIKVTSIYLSGAMPFIRTANGMRAFLESLFTFSLATCLSWLKAIAFSLYAVYLLRHQDCKPAMLFGFGILLIVSAFLLCLPYGLSAQYSEWALTTDTKGCDVSYYAFYLLIAATTCFISSLFAVLKELPRPSLAAGLLSIVVFLAFTFVGFHSEYNNRVYGEFLDQQDNKYELFDKVIRSEEFDKVENNAVIYAPEFLGVYLDMSSLNNYANSITGKNYTFINEMPTSPESYDYILKYYQDPSVLALGKNINGQTFEYMAYFTQDALINVSEQNGQAIVSVSSLHDEAIEQPPDIIDK